MCIPPVNRAEAEECDTNALETVYSIPKPGAVSHITHQLNVFSLLY